MFPNSRNILFTGQPAFNHYGNNIYTAEQRAESLDEGVRLLLPHVVVGAMHNSGERFDAPTCHEETRIALQEDILGWANKPVVHESELVTWLSGPAGSGKSAVAQTIAQKLHSRGQLTASFFFSRAGGSEGRSSEVNLVATLAHQLSQSVPAAASHIALAVRKNPLVFDLALGAQVDALIVTPLVAISSPRSGPEKPRIIVVDGLDECRKEKDAQKRVVDALVVGLRRIPHHSHKLFITSRQEYNIVSIFKTYEGNILRRMELDNKWKPDDDIRTFLLAGFADIRQSHFYFQSRPADKTWPNLEDVETLVRKSSGQFIYASVVLKYIKSEENYNPITRLETILDLKNTEDQPYAGLDALYHYIFSQIQGVESVLGVLSLERLHESARLNHQYGPSWVFSGFLSRFLGLDKGLIGFRLRPLNSLLAWSILDGIRYKHASLPDFLLDETRSGNFYINSIPIAVAMVSQALKRLEDGMVFKTPHRQLSPLAIPVYYTKMLPLDQKFHVWTLLSSFNVVETGLCKQSVDSDNSDKGVADYFNWIVAESERYNDSPSYLSQPVARILTWLVDQLGLINANHFDTPQIDIWPFFMTEQQTITTKLISSQLEHVLEVLQHPNARGMEVEASHLNQMAFLCYLLPHIHWLDRSDLLGQYAMTTERYEVALICTAYYLLQLPEHKLVKTLGDPVFQFRYFRESVLTLIADILPTFLARSPKTTDLCFFMGLLYPVVVALGSRRYVSTYIHQAVEKFPFLTDPTSEDYIHTNANAKRALIESKIKTHLHKVAESRRMKWLFEKKLSYKRLLETFAVIDSRVSESCDRIEESQFL